MLSSQETTHSSWMTTHRSSMRRVRSQETTHSSSMRTVRSEVTTHSSWMRRVCSEEPPAPPDVFPPQTGAQKYT